MPEVMCLDVRYAVTVTLMRDDVPQCHAVPRARIKSCDQSIWCDVSQCVTLADNEIVVLFINIHSCQSKLAAMNTGLMNSKAGNIIGMKLIKLWWYACICNKLRGKRKSAGKCLLHTHNIILLVTHKIVTHTQTSIQFIISNSIMFTKIKFVQCWYCDGCCANSRQQCSHC